MRVLLDEQLDWRLGRSFGEGFEVETVARRGWRGKKNGELLALMEGAGFDALVTIDKGIPHQQNLSRYAVAVVSLAARSAPSGHRPDRRGQPREDPVGPAGERDAPAVSDAVNAGPRDDLLDPTPLSLGAAPEVAHPTEAPLPTPVLALAPADDILLGEENPVLSYLARLSEGSRRTMRGSLEEIARASSGGEVGALRFPWWRLTGTHTALIRAHLAGRYAPATANKMLSALKGVLKACFRLGLMTADERDRASDVAPVRGTRLPPGRSIPRGELSSLFAVCAREAEDPKMRARGVRDAAMLALLYVGGLRRAELASLRLGDYEPETGTLRVRGKGNKERPAYAEGGADLLLGRWLELRGEGSPDDPLFLPVRKDGRVEHADPHGEKKASLSDQAVYKMVKRRHREANVKEISPHDFRKTFVGDLLDAVGDLSVAQKLAGHSDPATTARYDRRGERAMRRAASHLHVPHFDG